jgi:hypothetical protein
MQWIFNIQLPPLLPTSPVQGLTRVQRFSTKSLRQGRFSQRVRGSGALSLPSPLVYPSPARRARGKSRRANRRSPLHPSSPTVGEGLGMRAKQRERLAYSEPKRCTLISPCLPHPLVEIISRRHLWSGILLLCASCRCCRARRRLCARWGWASVWSPAATSATTHLKSKTAPSSPTASSRPTCPATRLTAWSPRRC